MMIFFNLYFNMLSIIKAMNNLEIYVHIPFCVKKCLYCDFCSFASDEATIRRYIAALIAEIRAFEVPQNTVVKTVYFGGGTPSYIDAEHIARVVHALEDKFNFDLKEDQAIEATIEVNPASAMAEKLAVYRALGFNRLSVGCQSTDDGLLKTLGRAHTSSDFFETLRHAESAGFTNVSADLMFGLPKQSMRMLIDSAQRIMALPVVKHLSCYSLIVEPGTSFAKMAQTGQLELPDEQTERAMYHEIRKRTAEQGFAQYEISNFAKPGYLSRHNSGYWDLTPYAGFGLGASSLFDAGHPERQQNYERVTNTSDLSAYIQTSGTEKSEKHLLPLKEAKGDFMFLGLRKTAGVRDADYHAKFKSSFFHDYRSEIEEIFNEGLIAIDENDRRIFLTAKGLDLANQAFMVFV